MCDGTGLFCNVSVKAALTLVVAVGKIAVCHTCVRGHVRPQAYHARVARHNPRDLMTKENIVSENSMIHEKHHQRPSIPLAHPPLSPLPHHIPDKVDPSKAVP